MTVLRDFANDLPLRVRAARWIGHQRWIPRGQNRLLYLIFNPDRGYDLPFEVDFFGSRYRGNTRNLLDWIVLLYGAYSPSELSALEQAARYLRLQGRRVVYLDIGVNVGHHMLFMSRFADELYGFDPNTAVLAHAREKMELNLIANARLFEVALGDRNGTADYFPPQTANEGTGSLVSGRGGNSSAAIPITVREADEFLAEQGIAGVGIIKIDVEGFEPAVFRGLRCVIQRDRPFFLVEVSPKGLAELQGEKGLRSCLYEGAQLFEVTGRNRLVHTVIPYRFESRECEVLIVPPEHLAAFLPCAAELHAS